MWGEGQKLKNNFNTNLITVVSSFPTVLKCLDVNIYISLNNVTLIVTILDAEMGQKPPKGVSEKTCY